MKVRDAGEAAIIACARAAETAALPSGWVGIGDDAAFIPIHGSGILVSCDMLVEGVHFSWEWTTPEQLGGKAVTVNASDIAAMGGRPLGVLVSAAIPPDTEMAQIQALFAGMGSTLARYDMKLLGGDTVASTHSLTLDVTVLGVPGPQGFTLRRGARVGDHLLVTGHLGSAYGGLRLLQEGERWASAAPEVRTLLRAHLAPEAKVSAGLALATWAHALTDISDGLWREVVEFCEPGGFGARLHAGSLPLASEARTAAARLGEDPVHWALYGGEDYELLAAVAPTEVGAVETAMHRLGLAMYDIGELTAEPGIRLVRGTHEEVLGDGAFDQFRLGWPGSASP